MTGAAHGIGLEYARQLASSGYYLILVDKDPVVVDVASSVASSSGNAARAIVSDLAREYAAEEVHEDVAAHGEHVDVLINNAGEFSFCDICMVSDEKIHNIITLHDMTMTKMNRLFAADMAAQGGGFILNMSSFSIWMPFPGLALYSASKAYVKAFSVAFSKEVREKGIYVTAVCPAGVATDLYGLSPRFQKIGLKSGALITPANCARRALRALFHHRRCIVPDWWNRLFVPILMHLPNNIEQFIRRKTMKYQS